MGYSDGIEVKFMADLTDYMSGVQEVMSTMQEVGASASEADALATSLADMGTAAAEAASGVSEVSGSLSGIADGASAVSEVSGSISGLDESLTSVATTATETASSVSESMTEVGASADMAATQVAQAGSTGGEGFSGGLMGGLSKAGMAFFVIQGGLNLVQGAFQQATGPFGNFQEQMTQLVTGAGESRSAIGGLSSGIEQMSVDVGTSTDQLTAGMYMVDSAGFTAAKGGLTVLKDAAEGAKVGNADLATVANVLTSDLNAYGQGANMAAADTNQLIATVAAGKMHMTDLANSLSAVLPVAAAAHISYAQIGGAIATMTAQGTSAQQATQNLANTIRSLQSPNAQAVQELQAMGLNANQVAMQLGQKGLTGTLQEVTEAIFNHMGPAGTVLQSSFKSATTAMADAKSEIAAMPASLQGVAEKFLAGSLTTKEWSKDISGLDPITKHMMTQFAATAKQTESFNSLLTKGGPQAQTYTAALSKILGGATGMNTALQLTGTHMATFQANVNSVANAAKTGGSSIAGWSDVQQDFNQKMAQAAAVTNVFWINLGQHLAPVILSSMSAMQTAVSFVDRYHTAFLAAAAAITVFFLPALIKSGVEATVAGAKIAAMFVKNVIMAGVEGYQAAGKLAVMVGQYIATGVQAAWAGIQVAAKFVWSLVQAGAQAVVTGVKFVASLIPAIISFGVTAYTTAATAIPAMIAGFIAWSVGAWSAAAATIAATWPILLIIAGIALLVVGIILLVKHWGAVTAFLQSAWKATMNWLIGAFHTIATFFSDIWADIIGIFNSAINWIVTAFHNAVAWVYNTFIEPYVRIWAYIQLYWAILKIRFQLGMAEIRFLLQEAISWIYNTFIEPYVRLWAYIQGFWAVLKIRFQLGITEIQFLLQNVLKFIENLFTSLPAKALQWGQNFLSGFLNGIKNIAGGIGNFINSTVLGPIKSFLGFHSPTEQGEGQHIIEWGYNMVYSFVQGMQSGTPLLQAAVTHLIQPAVVLRSPSSSTSSGSAPLQGNGGGQNSGQQIIQIYWDSTLVTEQISNKQAQLVQVRQGIRQW